MRVPCWGLTTRRLQVEVAALVAGKGLSVRETEAIVRRMSRPGTDQPRLRR